MRFFLLLTVMGCSGAVKPEDTAVTDPFSESNEGEDTADSSDTTEPLDSSDPVSTAVVINEILSDSDTTSDWLELYNSGSEAIELSGYGLADALDDEPSALPADTIIPAGGYLIVWADDGAGSEAGPHVNFKLSKEGETVYFFDPAGVLLDEVSFPMIDEDGDGAADPDKSWGRVPDGHSEWAVLSPPTPETTND